MAGIAGASSVDKNVTFSATAAPADRLLKALGEKAGVPLRATPNTAKDVLLISVKDVPLNVVMDRIAKAENASWEPENDGFRLIRSTTQQRADEDRDRAALAARYASGLQKVVTEANGLKALTDISARGFVEKAKEASAQTDDGKSNSWQRVQALTLEAPSGRLLTRLVALLRASDLAMMPENSRLVFSDNPNRMQQRFAVSPSSALQAFVREQSAVAVAAGPGLASQNNNPYMQLNVLTGALKSPPVKVNLTVIRRPFETSLTCNLEVLDAKGNILSQANRTLGSDPFRDMMSAPADRTAVPIKLSDESRQLRAVFQAFNGRGNTGGATLTPELKKKVADPFANEPLSYATSDMLLQVAEAKQANLVAVLSDMSIAAMFPMGEGEMNTSQVTPLLTMSSEEMTVADGWMTVLPVTPAAVRKSRCDRFALSHLLQTVVKKGTLSLDDGAAYALTCPGVNIDIIAMLSCAAIEPTAVILFESNGMAPLRFYGGLSQAQRQIAAAKQPINFASLSSGQRNALFELTFGAESRLNMSRTMAFEEGQAPIFPTNDPTELLPNGIPNDGRFTLTSHDEFVVLPIRSGGVQPMDQGMTATDLAWRVFSQENPEVGGSWASDPANKISLDKLMPAQRTTVSFHFDMTPKIAMDQQLHQISSKQSTVAFASLPETFRKAFEKTLADQKANRQFYVPTRTQGSPPPPAR